MLKQVTFSQLLNAIIEKESQAVSLPQTEIRMLHASLFPTLKKLLNKEYAVEVTVITDGDDYYPVLTEEFNSLVAKLLVHLQEVTQHQKLQGDS